MLRQIGWNARRTSPSPRRRQIYLRAQHIHSLQPQSFPVLVAIEFPLCPLVSDIRNQELGSERAAAILAGHFVLGLPAQIQPRAWAKLTAIDASRRLDDLKAPSGNRLEVLRSDRLGQHSVRINEQCEFVLSDVMAMLGKSKLSTITLRLTEREHRPGRLGPKMG